MGGGIPVSTARLQRSHIVEGVREEWRKAGRLFVPEQRERGVRERKQQP